MPVKKEISPKCKKLPRNYLPFERSYSNLGPDEGISVDECKINADSTLKHRTMECMRFDLSRES